MFDTTDTTDHHCCYKWLAIIALQNSFLMQCIIRWKIKEKGRYNNFESSIAKA
jgi:hypothetical protein